MKGYSEKRVLFGIVALGGIARIIAAVPVLLDPTLAIRNDNYLLMAGRLLETGAYTDALYGPGYPVFLTPFIVFMGAYAIAAVVLVQVLLSTVTVYLSAVLAGKMFRSDSTLPIVAAVLVAIHPSSIIFTPQVLTETFYTFILMIVLVLLMRRQLGIYPSIASGLLIGVAALTRGNGLIFGVLISFFILLRHYRPSVIALFILSFTAPVFLWSYHNLSVHGHFSPTASGDYNVAALFVGPAKSESEGTPPGANIEVWVKEMDKVPEGTFELSAQVKRMAIDWVRENPGAFLKSLLIGQARAFAGPGAGNWMRITGVGLGVVYALACMNIVTSTLALLGAVALWRGNSAVMLGFLFLIIIFHVLPSGTSGQSRFLVPAYPLVAMLSAGGIEYLRGKFTSWNASANNIHPPSG